MDARTRGPRENISRITINIDCNTLQGDPRRRCGPDGD